MIEKVKKAITAKIQNLDYEVLAESVKDINAQINDPNTLLTSNTIKCVIAFEHIPKNTTVFKALNKEIVRGERTYRFAIAIGSPKGLPVEEYDKQLECIVDEVSGLVIEHAPLLLVAVSPLSYGANDIEWRVARYDITVKK